MSPLNDIRNQNRILLYADREWETFVRDSRKGMATSYDVILGPMLYNSGRKFYSGKEAAKSGGQQTAVDLLNKYMRKK